MWKALMILIIAAATSPFIFTYYDSFTNPTTGILVGIPTPEWLVVLLAMIPWAYPVGLLVYAIMLIAGKDKPSV